MFPDIHRNTPDNLTSRLVFDDRLIDSGQRLEAVHMLLPSHLQGGRCKSFSRLQEIQGKEVQEVQGKDVQEVEGKEDREVQEVDPFLHHQAILWPFL